MLRSLAILFVEHVSARKLKYDKITSDFAEKRFRQSPTMHSNRLLGVVRSTGALLRASS